jgi:hypothetical protein
VCIKPSVMFGVIVGCVSWRLADVIGNPFGTLSVASTSNEMFEENLECFVFGSDYGDFGKPSRESGSLGMGLSVCSSSANASAKSTPQSAVIIINLKSML